MDHPARSRPRWLFLAGLVALVWGYGVAAVEEARRESPAPVAVVRATGARLAPGRISLDPPPLAVAVPAPEVVVGGVEGSGPASRGLEPRSPVRRAPAAGTELPRAPPVAPALRR